MVDNRVMSRRSSAWSPRLIALAALLLGSLAGDPALSASTVAEVDVLRTQFPAGSIDSVAQADAALGATAGAKARVAKDYKAATRECVKTLLVNDCLDRARLLQQRRIADIDAVELEANRYKRRDHTDKLDADRAQRENERRVKAPADADQRAKNRKSFDDKQSQVARDNADRRKADERRAQTPPHKPRLSPPPAAPEVAAAQRAKNAVGYASKVKEVGEHENAIRRNLAAKAADRKRRADAKAARDGAATRPAVSGAPQPLPGAVPPVPGPKP